MSAVSFGDSGLLQDADALLKEAGFSTRRTVFVSGDVEGFEGLLAEDSFFVLALITAQTLDDARRAEPFAVQGLLERISSSDVGAKRWDAYLVLLAAKSLESSEQAREVVELQYNTRGVRRLVATGVGDRAGLAAALRPFLPLPPASPTGLGDALAELSDQLVINGVAPESAPRFVAAFAQSGNLDDV